MILLIYYRGRKSNDILALNIKLDDISIERKTCTMFIGVYNYSDEKLDWSDHVKHIVTPISRNIGVLYRINCFVSDRILAGADLAFC